MNTEEDNFPILREEVEIAVKSLKKGKSAGVDNITAELLPAGGEAVTNILTAICNKIWQTGDWPTPWTQSPLVYSVDPISIGLLHGPNHCFL